MSLVCLIPYTYRIRPTPQNGIEQYSTQLLNQLRRMAVDVTVIMHRGSELGLGGIPSPSMATSALSQILRTRAHVYHATHDTTPMPLLRHPLVTTVHDVIPHVMPDLFGPVARATIRACAELTKRSARIIVPFESTKRSVSKLYEVDPGTVAVVKYGVDHETFFPLKRTEGGDLEKLLYVGGLERMKGVGQLIRAFAIVLRERKNARLLIGGHGPDEEYLKELTRNLKLSRTVTFLGFVPASRLNLLYNQSDVFVWPSFIGFGLTILEAMATGVPVVAARTFEIPELLDRAGIMTDVDGPTTLSEAILMVLQDSKLRRRLRSVGRNRVAELSWERMGRETLKVYRDVVNRTSKGLNI